MLHNVTYYDTAEYQIDMAGVRAMDPRQHQKPVTTTDANNIKELLWKQYQASRTKSIPVIHR